MMFIMGLSAIIANFCGLFPGGGDCWLATQMSHVDWEGFHHHDTIFALFLFISGMTFPFSSAKKMTKGMSRSRLCLDVLRRACVLLFLGLVYQGIFQFHFATLRFPSVLAAAAWSVGLFAIFYYLIDVKGWRKGVLFFQVVGMNSITIYLGQAILRFDSMTDFFFGGIMGLLPEPWSKLVFSLGYFALCWLLLYFLYKKNCFLKV